MSKVNGPFWRYQVALDNLRGREFHDGVINDPLSKEEAETMLRQHYGNAMFVTINELEQITVPDLTENEKTVLRAMLEWDQDYSFGYGWLDVTRLDRKELKKCMKHLRELGLVRMSRGGINDDGEVVGGTGFWIKYHMRKTVEAIVGKAEHDSHQY